MKKDYPYMIKWSLMQLIAKALHRPVKGYIRTLAFWEIINIGGWR